MSERIEDRLTEAFRAISRVEGIYLIPHGETLTVFTIIDNDDEETYDLIYEKERSLIHNFAGIHFDFNVIARRGRSIPEIIGVKNPIWERSASGDLCLTEMIT
jgi:hypothetical protein